MKILIVTQYFWPENFKINDFAFGMQKLGHEVTVLTGLPNYPFGKIFPGYGYFKKRRENINNVKVIRSLIVTRGKGTGARLFLNYFSYAFFASISVLFKLKDKNDIIFVYEPSPITVGIPAILLKFLKGIPIIFWVQDLWPESVIAASKIKLKLLYRLINMLVIFIYKNCDIIYISSRSFKKSILEKGVDESKIIYFPSWAEDAYLKTPDIEKVKKMLPDGFKIMFAGNIGEAQDFDSIYEVMKILKEYEDIKWIILGDGRKKNWLKNKIEESGLENVYLLGSFPYELMSDFFVHADALLVSLKDEEIFSLTVPAKIQTYLAAGRPILAMINGEASEIIEEAQAGFTCKAGDVLNLKNNILKLKEMSLNERKRLGENGRKYYLRNFERDLLFKQFINTAHNLIR